MINYQATPDMSASKWHRLHESNANDVSNKEHKNQLQFTQEKYQIPMIHQ